MIKQVNTISEELQYRYARENVVSMLSNGEMKHWVQGMWIDNDAFNILYPIAVFVPKNDKGDNPDRRNAYLNDKKSY